jgi:hypothetical protein
MLDPHFPATLQLVPQRCGTPGGAGPGSTGPCRSGSEHGWWRFGTSRTLVRQSVTECSYQGETWMLDSPEGVCAGQVLFEYRISSYFRSL